MPLRSRIEEKRRQLNKDASKLALGCDDGDAGRIAKGFIKPDDQLDLTEAELSEEFTKVLQTDNTNVSKNLVEFSYKDSGYVKAPPAPSIVTLFECEGTAIHIESPEAKEQMAEVDEANEGEVEKDTPSESDIDDEAQDNDADGIEDGAVGDDVDDEGQKMNLPSGKKRKLINQFNYCERGTLTPINPTRVVETQTIAPPRSTFGGSTLQWVIYDSYAADYEKKQREKEKEKEKEKKTSVTKFEITRKSDKNNANDELSKKYLRSWQILERMINQNIFDEIAQDYRYFEDPSDEFRDEEGTLLPLWKFSYDKTKKLNVTDLCFNTHYYDLFAVCYGSTDFLKQAPEGHVCLFTIKNPSFPEFRIQTESGVLCCDIHPRYSYLVVIGMYDGNVAVYNLKKTHKEPIYMSRSTSKHSDSIWEVKWGPDMPDGELNFYSSSADGRIVNWVLMQNKLSTTTIMTLYYADKKTIESPDGTSIKLKGCATCMSFHPAKPEIYLIGTEEGLIMKCSNEFSSKYLITYQAHYLPVYRIDFNKYNSNIFASCAGDWRVKIWEDMRSEPLFIFDLGASVGDVKWAPYSSTVFAACTSEGKVYVFDLNVNKYKAICIQQVVQKRTVKCTRLCFNSKLPYIIVGDDKGMVTSLKLSPNLRLKVKPPKKQQYLEQHYLQCEKLEKLLSLVRELPEDAAKKDGTSSMN